MDSCVGCKYWIDKECFRYPPTEKGYPLSHKGCGERREDAVKEREITESNIIEHKGAEEVRQTPKAGGSDSSENSQKNKKKVKKIERR